MDNSTPPTKIYTAWGQSATPGYLTAVPQTTTVLGAASWQKGWNTETFLAPGSGGTAPLGDYFNGAMNQLSDNIRWLSAGGLFPYDATYSTNIGGYMKNAILLMGGTNGPGLWISTANNNTVNPDTGTPSAPAAGWAVLQPNTYPWSAITGAPSFVLNSAFTGSNQSLVTNGYQKHPGGLMEQWCDTPLSAVSNQVSTITYPIPFPASPGVAFCPLVTIYDATLNAGSSSNQILASVNSFNLAGCNIVLGQNGGGARNITVHVEVRGRWA